MTNQISHRNVVRSAFGIQRSECLLILQVGPKDACRGIIAVVSNQSLLDNLKDALPLLTAEGPKNSKKPQAA